MLSGKRPDWAKKIIQRIDKNLRVGDLGDNYNWVMVDNYPMIFDYGFREIDDFAIFHLNEF